jgi:hypothetical protein
MEGDIRVIYAAFNALMEILKTPFPMFGVTLSIWEYLLVLAFGSIIIWFVWGVLK